LIQPPDSIFANEVLDERTGHLFEGGVMQKERCIEGYVIIKFLEVCKSSEKELEVPRPSPG
jgi:hypothetical protein